jgi:cation diffusion facilitator CzcD-associated flavoprotein CzcO
MTDEVKTVEAPKNIPAFASAQFQGAGFMRNEWHLTLLESQDMADVERPILWKHIMARVKRGDLVEAFKPDTGEWSRFVVSASAPGFIKLGKIEGYTPEVIEIPDGALKIKWNVGKRAHDVIRAADGFVMAGGFQTKGLAASWIADHEKKVAA